MIVSPWEILLERCAGATEVVIVAPYIKVITLTEVIDQLHPEASIECFTRWTPRDIQAGASDLNCRTVVVNRGGSFRLHNRLHAKYYRFDDQVLVGSANLTKSGLSHPPPGNMEILCEPGAPFVPAEFEAALRRESRDISDDQFRLWQQHRPVERASVPTTGDPADSSLDDWIPQTQHPEYLWLYYSGSEELTVSKQQQTLAQRDIATLEVPPNLTLETFRGWVRLCLETSPFMDSVRSCGGRDDGEVWDAVAAEWRVSRSTASMWVSTAHNWLRFFDSETAGLGYSSYNDDSTAHNMTEEQYRGLFKALGIEARDLNHVLRVNQESIRLYFNRTERIGVHFIAYLADVQHYPTHLWDRVDPRCVKSKDRPESGRFPVVPRPGVESRAFEGLLRSRRPAKYR